MMHAITLKKIENEGSQMGHTKKYLEKKRMTSSQTFHLILSYEAGFLFGGQSSNSVLPFSTCNQASLTFHDFCFDGHPDL